MALGLLLYTHVPTMIYTTMAANFSKSKPKDRDNGLVRCGKYGVSFCGGNGDTRWIRGDSGKAGLESCKLKGSGV